MSRIQQILEKAEKDGTARGVAFQAPEERALWPAQPAADAAPSAFDARLPSNTPESIDRRSAFDLRDGERVDEAQGLRFPTDESAVARGPVEATLSPVLVAALEPLSPAAEQYRALRSRITRAEAAHPLRVIQITSPGKHDGKTVTAVNLALTMAEEFQRRVLVMDTDLRRPSVHELLGLPPGPGLVDVLTGEATLEEALVEIADCRLTVLRAGGTYDRPAEMLGSAPMRRLVDTLRAQFDWIVIDSAPAIVADPGAVAPLADGLVLVVRAGSTTKPAIARAIQTLGAKKLLGLVFNASGTPQQQYAASA
jgi:protein-tyrosine kinase